jgi:multiple sugar transport system ATP-binding protein
MANLTVENLSKAFGKVDAVRQLSFDCTPGELLFIFGPSGAGKTTTLMLIAGLIDSDSGKIFIDNKEVSNLQPFERNMSMAFESYALYPHYSVFDNLAFPLRSPRHVPKMSNQEIVLSVKKVAEMLKIGELLDRKPGQLSGGQRQRVSLGRVLIRNADLYLLDEPLLHLDAKLRYEMMGELKDLKNNLDITMIMVGPDFVEALSIADRIIVVDKGMTIQQIGTPEEIYQKPHNLFVADLVGEPPTNFFECSIISEGDQLWAVTENLKVEIPSNKKDAIRNKVKPTDTLIVGVRPADILIKINENDNACAFGNVSMTESLGWATMLECEIGKKIANVIAGEVGNIKYGDKVSLGFNEGSLLFFEKKNGLMI